MLDLELVGTVGAPRASGSAEIAQGRFDDPTSGLMLRNISARVSGSGETLKLERFSATDRKGGEVTGSGTIDLGEAGIPLKGDIRLAKLAVAHDTLTATLDGQLSLGGSILEPSVSGDIRVDHAEATIPERLPANVVKIDVVDVNGPPRPQPAQPEPSRKAASPQGVRLDVKIDMPGQVFVRGRGLDSEWNGTLQVAGAPQQSPAVNGELKLVRGRFDFLDHEFELSDGTITFPPGSELDPLLSVTATTQTQDLTATLKLGGRVSRPTLALSSSPSLPQDEILSRVLFGKRIDQLSPTQALQLAQSVQQLTGADGSSGLVSSIRKATGLDALNVTSTQAGGGALSVGKYIASGAYLSTQQGTGGQTGQARLEYEIAPQVSISSQVGPATQPGIGINWKFDY